VLLLTKHNLTFKRSLQGDSLAWLTDLESGQPVEGAPVTFTREGSPLAQGVTDADGKVLADTQPDTGRDLEALLRLHRRTRPARLRRRLVRMGGGDPTVVVQPRHQRSLLTRVWSTSTPIGPSTAPGNRSSGRGIYRILENDRWTLPPVGLSAIIQINDGMGNLRSRPPHVPVSENGTIHGDFTLAPDALTGYYSINVLAPIDTEAYHQASGFSPGRRLSQARVPDHRRTRPARAISRARPSG
jgi:hypothetical protein